MEKQNMLLEILEPNYVHKDMRGQLVQLVREGFRQVNVISSKAGTERGGHYHKANTEAFYIITGALAVRLSRDGETIQNRFVAGGFFQISPYVAHWFSFEEDTILVSMYSDGVEGPDGEKDIFPCEAAGKKQVLL